MSLLEYFKNIEYHVPNNTDEETSNSIKKYQELGSQSKADAVGDKSIGKKPRMVQPGGKLKRTRNNRHMKVGGSQKCQAFDCPSVQYNNGSSLDQATRQINKEHNQHIEEANQMSGKAPPAKGGRRRFLHNTNKNKKNIYSYNIMRSKKRNLKGGKSNYPVDKASMISPGKQWNDSKTPAPNPSYNGGLYGASIGQEPSTADGPQAIGPWGTIDVTPTTTEFIQNNLKSATPPPGATEQYVGTSRVGNNYMAMPGVDWYNNTPSCNAGPHDIQGTVQSGGKKRKNNRKKLNSKKKLSKKKQSKKKLSKKKQSKKKTKKGGSNGNNGFSVKKCVGAACAAGIGGLVLGASAPVAAGAAALGALAGAHDGVQQIGREKDTDVAQRSTIPEYPDWRKYNGNHEAFEEDLKKYEEAGGPPIWGPSKVSEPTHSIRADGRIRKAQPPPQDTFRKNWLPNDPHSHTSHRWDKEFKKEADKRYAGETEVFPPYFSSRPPTFIKKTQGGGSALYSSNMDCGAPFSPRWDAKFNPANTPVSKKGMNTYTFIQEGGKKNQNKNKNNKKNKKQLGGLELRCKNMDCEGPYHPTW